MDAALIRRIVAIGLGSGAVVFVALLGGIGSGALTGEPTAADRDAYASTRTTIAAPGDFATVQFVLSAIDFDAGTVTISNLGDAAGDLDGFWLCNFPTYTSISGTVPAGGSLDVAFAPPAADGEVGLYSSRAFADASAIVAYVEWGAAGHTRSGVAVSAGVWDGNAVAPGSSRLVAAVPATAAAADWSSE